MFYNSLNKKQILLNTLGFTIGFLAIIGPFWLRIYFTPQGWETTGLIYGGEDYKTYLGKIRWGMEGHWLYENRFTSEITEPVPIYQFYLFLGHLAQWFGLSAIAIYQVARSFFAVSAMILLWRFLKKYIQGETLFTFLICLLASNGSMAFWQIIHHVKNYHPSGFFLQGQVGLGLIVFPHYALEFIGILFLLEAYFTHRYLLAGLGGFLISLAHPFLLALFCPLIFTTAILQKEIKNGFVTCLTASLAALPVTIPLYLACQKYQWLGIWRKQAVYNVADFSQHFISIYGLTSLFAWFAFFYWFKKRDQKYLLWILWLAFAISLSFLAPIPNKAEFSFFISLPFSVLAAPYMFNSIEWLKEKVPKFFKPFIFALIFSISTWYSSYIFLEGYDIQLSINNNDGTFLSSDYQTVFHQINQHGKDKIVLSTFETGGLIPVYTDCRPFVAHISETQDFKEKNKWAQEFFKGKKSKEDIQHFLQKYKIDWVIANHKETNALLPVLGSPVFEGKELTLWQLNH